VGSGITLYRPGSGGPCSAKSAGDALTIPLRDTRGLGGRPPGSESGGWIFCPTGIQCIQSTNCNVMPIKSCHSVCFLPTPQPAGHNTRQYTALSLDSRVRVDRYTASYLLPGSSGVRTPHGPRRIRSTSHCIPREFITIKTSYHHTRLRAQTNGGG